MDEAVVSEVVLAPGEARMRVLTWLTGRCVFWCVKVGCVCVVSCVVCVPACVVVDSIYTQK